MSSFDDFGGGLGMFAQGAIAGMRDNRLYDKEDREQRRFDLETLWKRALAERQMKNDERQWVTEARKARTADRGTTMDLLKRAQESPEAAEELVRSDLSFLAPAEQEAVRSSIKKIADQHRRLGNVRMKLATDSLEPQDLEDVVVPNDMVEHTTKLFQRKAQQKATAFLADKLASIADPDERRRALPSIVVDYQNQVGDPNASYYMAQATKELGIADWLGPKTAVEQKERGLNALKVAQSRYKLGGNETDAFDAALSGGADIPALQLAFPRETANRAAPGLWSKGVNERAGQAHALTMPMRAPVPFMFQEPDLTLSGSTNFTNPPEPTVGSTLAGYEGAKAGMVASGREAGLARTTTMPSSQPGKTVDMVRTEQASRRAEATETALDKQLKSVRVDTLLAEKILRGLQAQHEDLKMQDQALRTLIQGAVATTTLFDYAKRMAKPLRGPEGQEIPNPFARVVPEFLEAYQRALGGRPAPVRGTATPKTTTKKMWIRDSNDQLVPAPRN